MVHRRDPGSVEAYLAELGERIVRARQAVGIAVRADFARRLDVDRSTVERWESGRRAPDALNLLAITRVTSTTLDWLLRGFVSPAWRETFEAWAASRQDLDARARIWLESLPIEGVEPSRGFYDLALAAFRYHLTPARAAQMALENVDADRRNAGGG